MKHPDYYVWDFWYHYDRRLQIYHLFYLNADRDLAASDRHHFTARVGYGTTRDFLDINWVNYNVLSASDRRWDNTSIWTGDVIQIKNGFLMFYTSRNQQEDDEMTQNIGIAYAGKIDAEQWQPISNLRIIPDRQFYEPRNLIGDSSTHAWRDPFLFRDRGQIFMLLSAKSISLPLGQKGAIALLRSRDGSLLNWESLPPISASGWYSEMEVPQLYRDARGQYKLIYSTWEKSDFAPTTNKMGGLQQLTAFHWQNFSGKYPESILPARSGLYACRIVPELQGEIVGFNIREGGIERSGIQTHYRAVDRNFTDIVLDRE